MYLKEGKVEKGEAENELILTVKTKSIILAAETLDDYKKWFSAFSYVFVVSMVSFRKLTKPYN